MEIDEIDKETLLIAIMRMICGDDRLRIAEEYDRIIEENNHKKGVGPWMN